MVPTGAEAPDLLELLSSYSLFAFLFLVLILTRSYLMKSCRAATGEAEGKGCAPLTFIGPAGLRKADGWGNPLTRLVG